MLLCIFVVDVGEEQPRTILSGLVEHYSLEEMQGRIAIVMCNLKPVKYVILFSMFSVLGSVVNWETYKHMFVCSIVDERSGISLTLLVCLSSSE